MATKRSLKTILDVDVETFEDKELIDELHSKVKQNVYNKALEENRFPLRPSSALKSLRDLYYGLCNYYKPGSIPMTPIEGRNCMLLNLGHAIEAHLVAHIEQAYKVIDRNQKVTYGSIVRADASTIELSGELDFVLELPNGEKAICDSKSSAQFPFGGDLPKPEHIAQINLYLHSSWAKEQGIEKALVWYYNKNDSNLRVLEFRYSPLLAKRTIERFQKVYGMWEAEKLPAREYYLGVDWQAAYSNFKDYEWREYMEPRKTTIIQVQESELPRDKKSLLKYIVKTYGTQTLSTDKGRVLSLELKGGTLQLNETDAGGFSND